MFDWGEYRLLARDLLSQADNSRQKEGALRSAVSMAYYATFHAADDYLKGIKSIHDPFDLGSLLFSLRSFL